MCIVTENYNVVLRIRLQHGGPFLSQHELRKVVN